MTRWILILPVVLGLVVAACGGDDDGGSSSDVAAVDVAAGRFDNEVESAALLFSVATYF